MTMGMKAQAGPELMVVILMVVTIGILTQSLIFWKTNESWNVRASRDAQDICNGMASELTLAGYSEGRSAYFSLPLDIIGADYVLTVWNSTVTVDYAGHACVKRFNLLGVKYGAAVPPFNLTGGTYRINTTQGLVTLEKVT